MLTYTSDAIAVLATRRKQDPSKSDITLFAVYFQMLKVGVHVHNREFEYVTATPYNRISFIRLFWQCFYGLEKESVVMKVSDYLEVLRLLCPNFPASFLSKIKDVVHHCGKKTCVGFEEFIYILQVTLYYERFLAECEKLNTKLSTGAQDWAQVSIVVARSDKTLLATTESWSEEKHAVLSSQISEACKGDGKDPTNKPSEAISVFGQQVLDTRDKLHSEQWQCLPQAETLRHVLLEDSRVTSLLELILQLVQSTAVNLEIGILPNKNKFRCTEPPPLSVLPHKLMDSKSFIQVT